MTTTQRTPFLKQVADVYLANEADNITDYCFVTPNKRSSAFLIHYFDQNNKEKDTVMIMPEVITVSDLMLRLSDTVEPTRIEQLFLLYTVYADVVSSHLTAEERESPQTVIDFNKFAFWGETLLNDFGDVDRYLVDAKQLFANVKDLKEISANYLTAEQIDVIRRYWKESSVPDSVKQFWNHIVHNDDRKGKRGSNKQHPAGFIKLWQILFEVYTRFRNTLELRGLSYPGMTYRNVYERLKAGDLNNKLTDKRYVFVGFNALSASETGIFSELQRRGIADFYWDFQSPFLHTEGNPGARFLNQLVKLFPSRYDLSVFGSGTDCLPNVRVHSFKSSTAQVQALPGLLGEFIPKQRPAASDIKANMAYKRELVKTAVVLPEEHLFMDVANALSVLTDDLNITMGYQLRQTPVSSLIHNIVSMQLRSRKTKDGYTFFYEDVIAVLSHPVLKGISASAADNLLSRITDQRLFNIPDTLLAEEQYKELYFIFKRVTNADEPDGVIDYLEELFYNLMETLSDGIELSAMPQEDEDGNELIDETSVYSMTGRGPATLGIRFLQAYLDAITELKRLKSEFLDSRKVKLADKTVFSLVERLLGRQTVNFEGVPLEGLQIMGVLETRALDFDNVVIMSMNERIFPRKHYTKSFIPNALRKGYGMSTLDYQEGIYAYYFYRLISRAKNVFLLYNSSNSGVKSGAPSRYIRQLQFLMPKDKFHMSSSIDQFSVSKPHDIGIRKDEEVMRRLNLFKTPDSGKRFSASAIKTYIHCPLKFYLQYVEGFSEPYEAKEYVDDATFGNIIHWVLEHIYEDAKNGEEALTLTPQLLLTRFGDRKTIIRYLDRAIRAEYLKVDPDADKEVVGEAKILRDVMAGMLIFMFRREAQMLGQQVKCPANNDADKIEPLNSIRFRQGEYSHYGILSVGGENYNFYYRIDRIDSVTTADGTEKIRIIDYKTGGDSPIVRKFDELFTLNSKHVDGVRQLILYCIAYKQNENPGLPVQPFLYPLRKVAVNAYIPIQIEGQPLITYDAVEEMFVDKLQALFQEMYDPAIPFVQTADKQKCGYCHFKEICRPEITQY